MAQAWDQDNYQTLNQTTDVVSNQKKDTQILQVHFKACIVCSLGEQRHHTIRCGQGETLQFIL